MLYGMYAAFKNVSFDEILGLIAVSFFFFLLFFLVKKKQKKRTSRSGNCWLEKVLPTERCVCELIESR